jgi:hypothetical protein
VCKSTLQHFGRPEIICLLPELTKKLGYCQLSLYISTTFIFISPSFRIPAYKYFTISSIIIVVTCRHNFRVSPPNSPSSIPTASRLYLPPALQPSLLSPIERHAGYSSVPCNRPVLQGEARTHSKQSRCMQNMLSARGEYMHIYTSSVAYSYGWPVFHLDAHLVALIDPVDIGEERKRKTTSPLHLDIQFPSLIKSYPSTTHTDNLVNGAGIGGQVDPIEIWLRLTR